MDKNLANRLQDIKAHEQAISEQKEFIRASFIAAIKETTNPSIKKIGNFLHTISYKDLENWDVSGAMLRNCLCCYIEENPLCVTLKVIEKLEKCAAKNKGANFHFWLQKEGYYSKFMHRCNFSVSIHFVKSILETFYKKLKENDISAV
jgi:hypothetical protein